MYCSLRTIRFDRSSGLRTALRVFEPGAWAGEICAVSSSGLRQSSAARAVSHPMGNPRARGGNRRVPCRTGRARECRARQIPVVGPVGRATPGYCAHERMSGERTHSVAVVRLLQSRQSAALERFLPRRPEVRLTRPAGSRCPILRRCAPAGQSVAPYARSLKLRRFVGPFSVPFVRERTTPRAWDGAQLCARHDARARPCAAGQWPAGRIFSPSTNQFV